MAEQILNESTILQVLDWAYDEAVDGVLGLDSAKELADSYLNKKGFISDRVDELIKWQNTKCATIGFVTNIGGLITLPVSIPSNLTAVIYIQLRMIAAIAYMGGYDLKNEKVRTVVFLCLIGNSANEITKQFGFKFGVKITENLIKKIPNEVIKAINKAIGFRLLTKFGEKGLINLGKVIPPIAGGVIAGALDYLSSNTLGYIAKNTFIVKEDNYFKMKDNINNLIK